ncbi:ECs_2282 family putative zinc-binding protein [Yersinia alsatica]|uniref:ECs_2282 family putative zinc-binding protein n=1 Tax=Yersinia alsatica TaxID=2890317 RepID=UPI0039A3D387
MEIKIACPDCGSERIKAKSEIHSLDDLVDASCLDCGRSIDKDDVITQARKLAIDSFRNSLGKS